MRGLLMMDQDSQNQNVATSGDNIQNSPANNNVQPQGVVPSNSPQDNSQQNPNNQNSPSNALGSPSDELEELKSKNKTLRLVLVIFIVIIVALIVGMTVRFLQDNKSQSQLNDAKQKNAQLEKAAAEDAKTTDQQKVDSLTKQVTQMQADAKISSDQLTASQAQVKTLTAQLATAQTNITNLQIYITSLTTVANQLKTTCGAACSSIVIPTPPVLAK